MASAADLAAARPRALALHAEGLGCRAIAKKLHEELRVTVSKTTVSEWVRGSKATGREADTGGPKADGGSEGEVVDPNPTASSATRARGDSSAKQGKKRADTSPKPDAPKAGSDAQPDAADTFEERVEHIADLIATGEWDGRKTARELATRWNVRTGTVSDYARAAAILARADRATIEQAREAALGRFAMLRRGALDAGDFKAAIAAETAWAKAAGVIDASTKIQIDLKHPALAVWFERVTNAVEAVCGKEIARLVEARVFGEDHGPQVIEGKVEPVALPAMGKDNA